MRINFASTLAQIMFNANGLHTPNVGRHHRYSAGGYGMAHRGKYRPHQGMQERARRIGGAAMKHRVRNLQLAGLSVDEAAFS